MTTRPILDERDVTGGRRSNNCGSRGDDDDGDGVNEDDDVAKARL